MEPLLDVRDFSVSREGRVLVRGDRFTVKRGEGVRISGASGSGKSTFLLALAGLLGEQDASSEFSGDVSGTPRIGIVFQNPYSQMVAPSVEEEIAFGLENRGTPRDAMLSVVSGMMEEFSLAGLKARPPWTLSGGECQRLSLAACLASAPGLLLLDEPLSYLDREASGYFLATAKQALSATSWVVADHETDAWASLAASHYRIGSDGVVRREDPPPPKRHPVRAKAKHGSGNILEVRDLCYAYGPREAPVVKNLSFSLARGETLAIVGKSGAGKTSVFRALCGRGRGVSGSFLFEGKRFRPGKGSRDLFSWVPQVPEHFFMHETVREEWGQAEEYARDFGIHHLADRNPHTLSEGEKRRLTLVSALSSRRPILLLDEPHYGLDEESRERLEELLFGMQEEGRSVIVISHDGGFCSRVAHRSLELEKKR